MSPLATNTFIAIFIMLGIFAIAALIYLIITMRNINRFVIFMEKEATPVLSRLQKTLEKLGDELDKTVDIINDVHKVSERVNLTIQLVQEIVTSPFVKLAGLSAGAKKIIQSLRQKENE